MAYPVATGRGPLTGVVVNEGGPLAHRTPLEFVEWLSFTMDRMWEIPGTQIRFGVNSLLLLLPGLGDLAAMAVSATILAVALGHYRVPRIVAARMVLNVLLDTLISGIPVIGNVWDVFFKADSRNVRLLREYAGEGGAAPRPMWRHWVFVASVLGAAVLLVALIAAAVALVVAWLAHGAGDLRA